MPQTSGQAARRRQPLAGGYARGAATRAQIVTAALRVFAEEGYARASTRQIARAAGVNPPALQYYFDSKDGLHEACAAFIVESADSVLRPTMQAAEAALHASPSQAVEALCDVLDALLDASLSARKSPDWARFSARVQAEQAGPAYPLIREGLIAPIQALATRLVAVALSRETAEGETRLRAAMVLSQVSAFHIHGGSTLQMLDWPDFDGARRDHVKALLRAHTRAALTAAVRASGEAPRPPW